MALAEGDELKVVYVENDSIIVWYPAEGGNYAVDHNHAGETTAYFRPEYNGGDDWYAGCIYIAPTDTVNIDNVDANAPAVKVLRNGHIMILKGAKMYNVMGQTIR